LAMRHPIALALFGIVLYYVMAWKNGRSSPPRRMLGAVAAAVGLVALAASLQAWDDVLLIAVVAAFAAGAARLALSNWGNDRRTLIGYGLLLAIGCAAAAVQYFHLARPPTHLEPAVLIVDHHAKPVVGYFIADTSDFVYVAPRVSPCQVGHVVTAYRRADIAEIQLSRRINVWPGSKGPSPAELEKCKHEEANDGLVQPASVG
jgi:hypothetical protein